ncbi:RES domain-containing protein [Planomicrobium sp. CPCC 101110]|uniref:RES domain-containing protein n=1 Tax=Planomicrobium sp. CPCC 101110 TaxID=2599619 RepID=UPI0011B3AA60|nr:RES domain-containing protein [Planomicrobium sp. CPCC 101110]TWT25309.1 RES domain-containing protein [Planomicrobium sp. CPCC 101110]
MKVCCEKCFNYEPFITYIKKEGIMGNCSFCKSEKVFTIDVQDGFFDSKLFIFAHKFLPHDAGFELERFFTKQIDLLSNSLSPISAKELLFYLFRKSIGKDLLEGTFSVRFEDSIIRTWDNFKEDIKHGNRFGFGIVSELKELLTEIIKKNEMYLEADKLLYRARLGKLENSHGLPYEDDQIMSPPKYLASEGRINPKGIPYLYLTTNEKTAIAEVRPYKGKEISVATVKIKKDIRISSFNNTTFHGETLFKQFQLYSLTNTINMELSKPADEDTKYFNYIPTQYIGELAKYLDFEGIEYRSALEEGKNYCLFNQDKVSWTNSILYRVKQLNIISEPIDMSGTNWRR